MSVNIIKILFNIVPSIEKNSSTFDIKYKSQSKHKILTANLLLNCSPNYQSFVIGKQGSLEFPSCGFLE